MSTTAVDSKKHARRWWTLGVLALSLVLIGMDNTILNVALPTIQREFSATASTLQWMVDSYILVFAGLLLTMGGLGDRFGRAWTLRIGLVVFVLSALAASYAQNVAQVIAARAVMGAGGALIMPSTLSIIVDVFKGPERARAISIWAASAGIAVGLGPLIGGALLENFWWGSVFLVNVPIAGVALVLGWWLVPDSKDPRPKPIDWPGAALSTGAVSVLVYGIIEAPAKGWTSPVVLASFAAAVLLAMGFAWRERTTRYPLLNFAFFRRPRFSAGAGAISVAFFALIGMVFGMTQYLQFVKGYTALEAGLRLLPIGAGIAVGARGGERINRIIGTKKVVAAGLVLLAVTLASINFFEPATPYWAIAIGVFFTAVAMGTIMAPSTESVMGAVPQENAGVGSAMNDVARQVAGAFGVAIVGSIMNTLYSSRVADAVDAASRAAGGRLPEALADASKDSVGAAIQVAAQLPGAAGQALATAAGSAFTEAFGVAVLAGTALALIGAVAVLKWMPPRAQAIPEDEVRASAASELATAPGTGG